MFKKQRHYLNINVFKLGHYLLFKSSVEIEYLIIKTNFNCMLFSGELSECLSHINAVLRDHVSWMKRDILLELCNLS